MEINEFYKTIECLNLNTLKKISYAIDVQINYLKIQHKILSILEKNNTIKEIRLSKDLAKHINNHNKLVCNYKGFDLSLCNSFVFNGIQSTPAKDCNYTNTVYFDGHPVENFI